jgi:hypothetical protein
MNFMLINFHDKPSARSLFLTYIGVEKNGDQTCDVRPVDPHFRHLQSVDPTHPHLATPIIPLLILPE